MAAAPDEDDPRLARALSWALVGLGAAVLLAAAGLGLWLAS